jgi:hypothetical protein
MGIEKDVLNASLANKHCSVLFSYDEREVFSLIRRIFIKIVSFFYIRPYKSFTFGQISDFILTKANNRVTSKVVEFIGRDKYDVVIFIKGLGFNGKDIEKIRDISGANKMLLYQWDSVVRIPSVIKIYKYFDTVFSFQKEDIQFYTDTIYIPTWSIIKKKCDAKFDSNNHAPKVIFIGSFSIDRFYDLVKLSKKLILFNIDFKFVLVCNFPINIKIFGVDLLKEVVSNGTLNDWYQDCHAMVELRCNGQLGSTQRVKDAITLEKKVLVINDEHKKTIHNEFNYVDVITIDSLSENSINLSCKHTPSVKIDGLNIDNWWAKIEKYL